MKRTFISAAAILAFAATAAHADELTDIQAQAKQLREQNAAMTKRLADIEKRQKALEAQKAAVPTISPVDAMAADLPYKAAVKAKPIENDDICIKGICVYGNFDMGINYQQHGSPFAGAFAAGANQFLVEKASNGPFFGVAANQMSTSFIGLRGKQEIGDNLYAVFNLQTLFNPASGVNASGLGAIVQNNGLGQSPALGTWGNSFGDSSKGGQMFNNAAYFGISSPTYGTFTMGRQSALTSDLVVNYDALSGSNAWSLITFEGATGGGGVTEDRIWDNSYEYRLNIGPVRLAAEAQLRNGGNSGTNNAFGGDIGFDYMGLSMDFVGSKIYDAVSVGGTLTSSQVNQLTQLQAGLIPNPFGPSFGCANGCMSGTISDNTTFQVAARYTIGPWKFYGGYEHVTYENPNQALAPGAFVYGGYNLGFVNNNAFLDNKNLNIFWVGVKYAVTPTLDVMGAYYGQRFGFFTTGAGAGVGAFANVPGGAPALGSSAAQQAACAANSASGFNCAGGQDMVSVAMDWRFARHVDFYAGVGWNQKFGGAANGFILSTNNGALTGTAVKDHVSSFDPGVGLRYQF
ncbi:MAG TPA: porin [Bradyrhizobium sp.]|uniref:porin n=1 Tax=Bradyrhizobium sp. TaxID=376 RepID=UPI002D7F6B20|nr:porin [Bradyrhizobium sp.]HET7886974.1 porin [Bradyrhizobium sp.]